MNELIATDTSPLNRSLSLSDLHTQRISIEQIFHSPKTGATLVRHISCEQFKGIKSSSSIQITKTYSRDGSGSNSCLQHLGLNRDINCTSKKSSSPTNSQMDFDKTAYINTPVTNSTAVATHIDLQTTAVDENKPEVFEQITDSSAEPLLSPTETSSKTEKPYYVHPRFANIHEKKIRALRRLNEERVEIENKPRFSYTAFGVCLLLPIVVALIAVVLLHHKTYNDTCESKKFKSNHPLFEEITEELLGQYHVHVNIKNIFSHLNTSHLLVFMGPTGVGKTLTSQLIIKHFQWPANIHHVISPFHLQTHRQDTVLESLSACGFNLVIIDSLKPHDAKHIAPFLLDIADKNSNVVIITIFNVEERDEENEIVLDLERSRTDLEKALSLEKWNPHVIVFKELTEFDLMECVRKHMKKKTIHMTRAKIMEVVKFMQEDGTGCKRVESKVVSVLKRVDYSHWE